MPWWTPDRTRPVTAPAAAGLVAMLLAVAAPLAVAQQPASGEPPATDAASTGAAADGAAAGDAVEDRASEGGAETAPTAPTAPVATVPRARDASDDQGSEASAGATAAAEAPAAGGSAAGAPAAGLRATLARAAEELNASNLNVGVLQNAPPFSYVSDHGYRTGFDFAVARAVCARLAVRCTFVSLVAEDVIPALTERRIDLAVTSMPISASNDQIVDFTRPYYATAARFVGAATPAGDAEAEAASGGVEVIGALAGTPHAAYLAKEHRADTVRLYFNSDELFVDLALGRLDKALLSAIEAKQRLLSNPIGADFGYVGAPVTDPDIFGKGQGIAVREGDEPLRRALDLALADLIRSGDMKEIRDRFLDPDLHISLNNSG